MNEQAELIVADKDEVIMAHEEQLSQQPLSRGEITTENGEKQIVHVHESQMMDEP